MNGLFDTVMPNRQWITQACTEDGVHLCIDVVGLLRGPDQLRILGAAEMATGLFFTLLSPNKRRSHSDRRHRPCRPRRAVMDDDIREGY